MQHRHGLHLMPCLYSTENADPLFNTGSPLYLYHCFFVSELSVFSLLNSFPYYDVKAELTVCVHIFFPHMGTYMTQNNM